MDCRETTRILSEALNDSGVQFYIRFWAVFRKSIGERHSVVSDKSHIFQTEKRLEIIYSRFGGVANFTLLSSDLCSHIIEGYLNSLEHDCNSVGSISKKKEVENHQNLKCT